MRLALFEPDIPQNTGALLRLAACFGVAVDLIEPCGFLLDDRRLKRAVLDYTADLVICRHLSWRAFLARRASQSRLIMTRTRCARLPKSLARSPFSRPTTARCEKSPSLPNGNSRSKK